MKIELSYVINCYFSLGEGLHIYSSGVSWVDINNSKLAVFDEESLTNYNMDIIPSIIYAVKDNIFTIGCDLGLIEFSTLTKKSSLKIRNLSLQSVEFRSNDGGFCGDYKLLSFMHRDDPVKNLGFVYLVKNESFLLLDDSLHIPNSFIEIEPSKILISDSLKGQIWLYQLDDTGNLVEKTLWAQLDKGIAPDGGCLVGDFVFVALWDGASIAVFDKSGKLIKKLPLPVIRPTNCKYDGVRSLLWVTSASEGLSKEQLSRYPLSGNTFVYNLELGS